jgi:methylaspartate ammonia-lyase
MNQNKIDIQTSDNGCTRISAVITRNFSIIINVLKTVHYCSEKNLLPSSGFVATDTEILHKTPWHIVLACPHAPM